MEFFLGNWDKILLALVTFLGTYTALTETKKDDKIVNILSRILQAVVLGRSRGKKGGVYGICFIRLNTLYLH